MTHCSHGDASLVSTELPAGGFTPSPLCLSLPALHPSYSVQAARSCFSHLLFLSQDIQYIVIALILSVFFLVYLSRLHPELDVHVANYNQRPRPLLLCDNTMLSSLCLWFDKLIGL